MPNSVMRDKQGPDWPLGLITVPTPGTPVGIMSLVDSALSNDPSTATPAAGTSTQPSAEYSERCQQIIFVGVKPGAAHGTQNNTGNVYITRKGAGAGSGNRDDQGAIVYVLTPGANLFLGSAASNRNVFSPYRYSIDADNAGDGALVTLIIQ
jgi:hypothetical protein